MYVFILIAANFPVFECQEEEEEEMAYNLQSLITILEQILNPEQTRWILDQNQPQLQSLHEKAASLQQILEKSSLPKTKNLAIQIREAAHKAEDMIESHMVDRMLSTSGGASFTFSTPDLQQLMQELDSIMKKVAKLGERKKTPSGSSSSTRAPFSSFVVGVDEDLLQLKDRLTGMQSKLEIIPIVGMGGIGKTTLARKLFQDPLIVSRFEVRAWTTISQDYNVQATLLSLLRCIIGKQADRLVEREVNELKDILHKSLYGRRYMIVIDDIWSTQAWDDMRRYFPDNNNESRIVMTTRVSDVAKHADSLSLQHRVQLLSKSVSWNLLRQIVFGEVDCPRYLQWVGRKIANDCGGLPLAINVIGGLLSKLQRSRHVWEKIGNDVRAAIAESDKQFSNILSLSYDHLPNHLKLCFLYMGAFPEDYEIKASRLVRLWVAEGFLKSNEDDKSSEEEAEDCLKALEERNLLLVINHKYGKAKRYILHDMLRDVCMMKGEGEKFLHVVKNAPAVTFSNPRRVSVHTMNGMEGVCASPELMVLARSFLYTARIWEVILPPSFFMLRLLRVLDAMGKSFSDFPTQVLQLVNLRYLAVSCKSSIPSGISRLCYLQTLDVKMEIAAMPVEIWELSELRHLKVNKFIWFGYEYMKKYVQEKLQTISPVMLTQSLISNGFLESIPNIKDLGICCWFLESGDVDLTHLRNLGTLRWTGRRIPLLPTLKFPTSLKKLTLDDGCRIFPEFLTSLCSLPKLKVLKVKRCHFEREGAYEVWEAAEGDEFCSLEFLSLELLDNLVEWRADETNFPRLRHLVIDYCSVLKGIPTGIGEIPTLELIELRCCSESLVESAKQIEEVQQSDYGNYDLKLVISS